MKRERMIGELPPLVSRVRFRLGMEDNKEHLVIFIGHCIEMAGNPAIDDEAGDIDENL